MFGLFKKRSKRQEEPFVSSAYWRERYADGRNSGAGSYGRLAQYKADFINALVLEHDIQSIVEFGSGDGNQASLFDFKNFLGVDVVPQVVEACALAFSDRDFWSFKTVEEFDASPSVSELSLSLDVIYHLIEDDVFDRYMRRLFEASKRYVLIYSSDHHETVATSHVKHRKYSEWISENAASWSHRESFQNPYRIELDGDAENSSFAHFALFELQ